MMKMLKSGLLLVAVGILSYVVYMRVPADGGAAAQIQSAEAGPETACELYISELLHSCDSDVPDGTDSFCDAVKSLSSGKITNTSYETDISVCCSVILTLPDEEKLLSTAEEELASVVYHAVQNASDTQEVYTEEFEYQPDFLNKQFNAIIPDLMTDPASVTSTQDYTFRLQRTDGQWRVTDDGGAAEAITSATSGMNSPLEYSETFKQSVFSALKYIAKDYPPIDEAVVSGFSPDENCYGESDSIEEIKAVVSSPRAQHLIGSEGLSWSEDIQLAPGTSLKYYLDDTILVLTWNELHGKFTETFSEVFIADASQFRRKLTDDMYHSETLLTVQELSEQTNAVLAESGDMSGRRNRDIGIFVYNREIFRFEPGTGDTCFIDSKGNMLFSHRGELSTREEAETYIADNDILFSLCFGPVMVEEGSISVPEGYAWGEPYEDYMRNAFGQIGERHYLIYNSDFMTVSDAAEIMLQRGCISAYALDGGFTACTVLNNARINPIVKEERPVSDIIYYVTAVPDA